MNKTIIFLSVGLIDGKKFLKLERCVFQNIFQHLGQQIGVCDIQVQVHLFLGPFKTAHWFILYIHTFKDN